MTINESKAIVLKWHYLIILYTTQLSLIYVCILLRYDIIFGASVYLVELCQGKGGVNGEFSGGREEMASGTLSAEANPIQIFHSSYRRRRRVRKTAGW